MYDIEMHEVSREFALCWATAGQHLNRQAQGGPIQSWLKADLSPPFLEHLSFRLGNQLFFVQLEDVDGVLEVPGNPSGLFAIADGCNGIACIMPMRKRSGSWTVDVPGWGLLDARTGLPIDPAALITDERVEMTEWEVQDFAVQIVRDQIKKDGRKLISWQGNPKVDPSIWFVGANGPEWVVVRATRYPAAKPIAPSNWDKIAASCARMSRVGHFAPVSVASADQPFASKSEKPVPLWRGHGMIANFAGLERRR